MTSDSVLLSLVFNFILINMKEILVMKSLVTNYGRTMAVEAFKNSIDHYILLGANSDNDTNLINLLDSMDTSLNDYDINDTSSNIYSYLIGESKPIVSSIIDNERKLVFTINMEPKSIPVGKFIYAVILLDKNGNVFTINRFSEPFNAISEAGEIITIKHHILSDEVDGNQLSVLDDKEAYLSRREFIDWTNNHNHDERYVYTRKLNSLLDEVDQVKENKSTIGNLKDINSINNSNIVNVLNEIIGNIGNLQELTYPERNNIVEIVNRLYSEIGDIKDLDVTGARNIIDGINQIYDILVNRKISFKDGIPVEEVEWGSKADVSYVGDIDLFHGSSRENIIATINEIYDLVAANKNKLHDLKTINDNTNYKIFSSDQDYIGTVEFTFTNKGNTVINFLVDLNITPNTIKIYDVYIDKSLLNLGLLSQNGWDELSNYMIGTALVFKDRDFYLSIKTDEDLNGNKLFDRIVIDFAKVNAVSTLFEEKFDSIGSIAIKENEGNIHNNLYSEFEIDITESNKEYKLFNTNSNFNANIEIITEGTIISADLSSFTGDVANSRNVQIGDISGSSRLFNIDSFSANSIATFSGWNFVHIGSITLPGNPGAGVGIAPKSMLSKYGLAEMTGTTDPTHENYGNYVHTNSGSIMVYIPLHYQKITQVVDEPYAGMRVDISNTPGPGYHLPRVFINAGKIIPGIFIDKYVCSNSNGSPTSSGGTFVSLPGKSACTSDRLTYLNISCSNYLYYFYQAVKSRGSQFALYPIFAQSMLSNLADAIWQEEFRRAGGTNTVTANIMNRMKVNCAWADRQPFGPRMSTNNLRDNYDTSLVFQRDAYNSYNSTYTSLTGGTNDPSTFAKTTHNGQKCGISDLGGWYIVCSGFTHSHILKESEDLTNLVYYDVYGSVNTNKFESLNDSWSNYLGDTSTKGSLWIPDQILDRSNQEYKLMACNIAGSNPGARSSSGYTNRYGYTCNYKTTSNNAPVVGGGCGVVTAGVRCVVNRSWADSYGYYAGRACLLPTP